MTKRGYRETEAAEYLGLSPSTLKQARIYGPRPGRIPPIPYVKVGKAILYPKEALDKWIDENQVAVKPASQRANPKRK